MVQFLLVVLWGRDKQFSSSFSPTFNNLETPNGTVLEELLSSFCTIQVLASRTHPHMQMDAFGGYILSGIRIQNTNCMM
jgi:hypothetical protein